MLSPKRLFCRSAVRESLRSASAMASALGGVVHGDAEVVDGDVGFAADHEGDGFEHVGVWLHRGLCELAQFGFFAVAAGGDAVDDADDAAPCVGAYLSFVGSEEPYAWCRVEFCGRFHAHEGAQSEVGEGHERAGDAAGAEGAVELLVADDRHDGGVVEAGFDAFGLPCAAVAAAQVDLAWQPYVEAGDVAVFVFVADGHGRADPVVAPVP